VRKYDASADAEVTVSAAIDLEALTVLERAVDAEDFERAALLRDQIRALEADGEEDVS
jgi:protein-arginine kinase activator protein McsA